MTDQHRATPEQLSISVYPGDIAADPRKVADAINALSARIEALEAAQLEQAESHRFCTDAIVRRVEALEAAQQDKLDRLIALDAADPTPDPAMTELRAASAEARPAGGLVERVETRAGGDGRTAIREMAKWLDDQVEFRTARLLRREADRG
jgi:hypothetical protein